MTSLFNPLDTTLAQYFSGIFVLLFVFVVAFAIMQKYKFLGEEKNIHALIAAVIAFLFILTPITINLVANLAPMFIILIIFLVLFLFVFNVVGVTDEDITKVIKTPAASWTLGIIAFVIGVGAIGLTFGQTLLDVNQGENVTDVIKAPTINETGGWTGNILKTVFHPRFLGFFFIMAIAVAAIKLIAGKVIQ